MFFKSALIIEDDEGLQHYIKLLFKKHYPDTQLIQTYDGSEALELLSGIEQMPELILLDINMPGMDGFEFLKQIEHMTPKIDSKIVIVSSSDNAVDMHKVKFHTMVQDYIVKPIHKEDLDRLAQT